MYSLVRRRSGGVAISISAGAFAIVLAAGCMDKPQSVKQAIKNQKREVDVDTAAVGPVAGVVTVDGQSPPSDKGKRIIVVLNDPKKPLNPAKLPDIFTICGPDGSFSFTTFVNGDGVKFGDYVVTFALLHPLGLKARDGYGGPDEMKNLYNDPDVNAKNKEFNVNVTGAGKGDYHFNLELAGKDAVPAPGAHAVVQAEKGGRGR
jgi:hypothetical protein